MHDTKPPAFVSDAVAGSVSTCLALLLLLSAHVARGGWDASGRPAFHYGLDRSRLQNDRQAQRAILQGYAHVSKLSSGMSVACPWPTPNHPPPPPPPRPVHPLSSRCTPRLDERESEERSILFWYPPGTDNGPLAGLRSFLHMPPPLPPFSTPPVASAFASASREPISRWRSAQRPLLGLLLCTRPVRVATTLPPVWAGEQLCASPS